MKRFFMFLFIFVLLYCLSSCGDTSIYKMEKESEKEAVYQSGYDVGFEEGQWDGYDSGYDAGHYDGYDKGYTDGYGDGYYAGATYTCLSIGDVNRAFKCAQNGCAWDTFIDAYDEYVANIYDTDDMRSSIFGAFISLVVSDDATSEEIELLINTFGSDLFLRNSIELSP